MIIFDLEQEIMKTWHVVDDIQLLNENVMETDMSTDDIANALLGLENIYNMRFEIYSFECVFLKLGFRESLPCRPSVNFRNSAFLLPRQK